MHAKVRKFTLAVAAVAVATSMGTLSGCSNNKEVERPPDPTLPAKRAAQAWVHCLEQNGGACVSNLSQFASWDAYALLGWLATGTPTSILSGLRRELQHHRDPRSVQRRMVNIADMNATELRGAECRGVDALPFDEVISKLEGSASARMDYFGINNDQMEKILGGLANEARQGLSGGYFITMECVSAPYSVYVATAPEGDHFVVAGMMLELPRYLGGEMAARDPQTGALFPMRSGRSKQTATSSEEGSVHPWINIAVEEF